MDGPIPEMRVKLWTALSVSIPLGAITIFLMTIALKARRNKIVTGQQGMIGSIGEARTDIDPEGKVFVQGELWNAHAASRVTMGEHIVVKKIEGLELEVEKSGIEFGESLPLDKARRFRRAVLLPNWVTPRNKPTIKWAAATKLNSGSGGAW